MTNVRMPIFDLFSSLSIVTSQKMHCLRVILHTTMLVAIILLLSLEQAQSNTSTVDDPLLSRLSQLTEGLLYTSESDYPLEPVSFPTPLTKKRLIQIAKKQSPTGTDVERRNFTEFLRYHTSEVEGEMMGDLTLARRFQALESFMKQELENVFVYRVGGEPRIVILALGTTKDGQRLVGFRTVSIET